MGLPRVALSQVSATSAPAVAENGGPAASNNPQTDSESTSQTPRGGGTNWTLIIGMLIVGIGSVVGLCYLSIGQSRRRHRGAAARAAASSKSPRERAGAKK
jgi:hypothetical protein